MKPRKLKIRVVGLGGGGVSIVAEMAQGMKNVNFLAADTDARVFQRVNKAVRIFQFGEKVAGGMGTGMRPELARQAAIEAKEKIAKIFQGYDLSILVGTLGGGVASGAGPVFAEIAKNCKGAGPGKNLPPITLGIFTLPFAFEGEKKMRLAKEAVKALQENLSGIIVLPNEKIFQIIDKKTPLKKALSALNNMFVRWLSDLFTIIAEPNLINIDFADLRTILKARGKVLYFGEASASGPNRAEEVLRKIFQHPVLEKKPIAVERLLFNITGGEDLGLKEVEMLSQNIASLNPRAKIIFGIAEKPKYNGLVKLVLLAVGSGEKEIGKSPAELVRSKGEGSAPGASVKPRRGPPAKSAQALQTAPGEQQKETEKGRAKKLRRSALEIQKVEEELKERELSREPNWEIPAFLRNKL